MPNVGSMNDSKCRMCTPGYFNFTADVGCQGRLEVSERKKYKFCLLLSSLLPYFSLSPSLFSSPPFPSQHVGAVNWQRLQSVTHPLESARVRKEPLGINVAIVPLALQVRQQQAKKKHMSKVLYSSLSRADPHPVSSAGQVPSYQP